MLPAFARGLSESFSGEGGDASEYKGIGPVHAVAFLLLLTGVTLRRMRKSKITGLVKSHFAKNAARAAGMVCFASLVALLDHVASSPDGANQGLITDGLNAYVRHPVYLLAPPLFWGGLALISNSIVPLISGFACVFFLVVVAVPAEEKHLSQHFGKQWATYADSVPQWVPQWDGN